MEAFTRLPFYFHSTSETSIFTPETSILKDFSFHFERSQNGSFGGWTDVKWKSKVNVESQMEVVGSGSYVDRNCLAFPWKFTLSTASASQCKKSGSFHGYARWKLRPASTKLPYTYIRLVPPTSIHFHVFHLPPPTVTHFLSRSCNFQNFVKPPQIPLDF